MKKKAQTILTKLAQEKKGDIATKKLILSARSVEELDHLVRMALEHLSRQAMFIIYLIRHMCCTHVAYCKFWGRAAVPPTNLLSITQAANHAKFDDFSTSLNHLLGVSFSQGQLLL